MTKTEEFRANQSASQSDGELKELCVKFFQYWWNQPGTNTEEGFDKWFKQWRESHPVKVDGRDELIEAYKIFVDLVMDYEDKTARMPIKVNKQFEKIEILKQAI